MERWRDGITQIILSVYGIYVYLTILTYLYGNAINEMDILNYNIFGISLWEILHILFFYKLCYITQANTPTIHIIIFVIGISWYISEPYILKNINKTAYICSNCAYISVFRPKLSDLLFSGIGQIIFIIQKSHRKIRLYLIWQPRKSYGK